MTHRVLQIALTIAIHVTSAAACIAQLEPQPLPSPLWSWHGPMYPPTKAGTMTTDSNYYILSYRTGDKWRHALFDRKSGQAPIVYDVPSSWMHRDNKRFSLIKYRSLVTYSMYDASVLDSIDLGIEGLLIYCESADGAYLTLRKPLNTGSTYKWDDSIYVYNVERKAIISSFEFLCFQTAFFDPKDNALITSRGTRYRERNEPIVSFGDIQRIEPPLFKSARILWTGKPYDAVFCTPGAMFTRDGVASTSIPGLVLNQARSGIALPSHRYVTIDSVLTLYDSTHKPLLIAHPVFQGKSPTYVAERPDGVITINTTGHMVRVDPSTGKQDTILTPPYPPLPDFVQPDRVNQQFLAFCSSENGLSHFDLFNGRIVDMVKFPALVPVSVQSSRHPYNLRMGKRYYHFDSTFGTIKDQTEWTPPNKSALYSGASDKWFWVDPPGDKFKAMHHEIRAVRSFESETESYNEPFDPISDVCLSYGGDTAWVASVEGGVVEYDMKSTVPRRQVLCIDTQNRHNLYRVATRHHDSTLVGVWTRSGKAAIMQVSLQDTSVRSETLLDLPTHSFIPYDRFRYCALVVSDDHGYVAASIYPHSVLSIAYDDGRMRTIRTDTIITAMIKAQHDSVLLAVDVRGNVYWVDAIAGTLVDRFATVSQSKHEVFDLEYISDSALVCTLQHYSSYNEQYRLLHIYNIRSKSRTTLSKLSIGSSFLHDGQNLALFPNGGLATTATTVSLPDMKPSAHQPLLNVFPESEYRHTVDNLVRLTRSADNSTISYHTNHIFGTVAWVKGSSRQILQPMAIGAETYGRLSVSRDGEWLLYEGTGNTHIYSTDPIMKRATIHMPGFVVASTNAHMNTSGTYLVVKGVANKTVQFCPMKRPLDQLSPNGIVFQAGTLLEAPVPNRGTYVMNHPSYFAYVTVPRELVIRGPLKNAAPIATGLILQSDGPIFSFSPNFATLAVGDGDRLLLLDGKNFSLIREFNAGAPIHKIDWSSSNTSVYLTHGYDTFGKYSFAGVVSVDEHVQPPSDNCYEDIVVRVVDNLIQIERPSSGEALLVSIFSVDGRLMSAASIGAQVNEVKVESDHAASQRVIVLISGSNCQTVRSVMYP